MGDVDFYPNGGRMQTGCSNLFLGAVSDIIWCKCLIYCTLLEVLQRFAIFNAYSMLLAAFIVIFE